MDIKLQTSGAFTILYFIVNRHSSVLFPVSYFHLTVICFSSYTVIHRFNNNVVSLASSRKSDKHGKSVSPSELHFFLTDVKYIEEFLCTIRVRDGDR